MASPARPFPHAARQGKVAPQGKIVAGALLALLASLLLAFLAPAGASPAAGTAASETQIAWRLLDYVSVDYAGAVADGKIISQTEYAEQQEFAATARAKIASLPAKPGQKALLESIGGLQALIAAKSPPEKVATAARTAAATLLATYPVPLAPAAPPSFAAGEKLYSENCALCHGATGGGDGPAAKGLDTPPTDFRDPDRARERSAFALYQVITQGLDGTPMRSFAELPTEDRWALAFYVGHFAYPDAAKGQKIWEEDARVRAAVPDLKALVSLTPATLAGSLGAEKADAVTGFLRQHPEAVEARQSSAQLALVREKMAASLAASRAGNRAAASNLALSAYLDGFEPIEPTLAARNSKLMTRIESAMLAYRAAVKRETAGQLASRQQALEPLFAEAEETLAPGAGNAVSTFLGAATILLREGLEALLIIVAMLAFMRKAGRTEALPYVHAGWVSALVAGLLTWVAATWMISISGASRELTEGIGSVFAAVVLLSVGIWMHGKAQAHEWQRYIREKMAKALSGRSAWLLFGLAFIVVYREVFETILFYAALAAQGSHVAMLTGALTAVAALGAIAFGLLHYSNRLPISTFFSLSSWLMAILTVVLAGKGVAALQEAGVVGITILSGVPRVELVGLFPTVETVGAQAVMVVAIALGFYWNHRRALKAA